MALLWIDGFDLYNDDTDLAERYTSVDLSFNFIQITSSGRNDSALFFDNLDREVVQQFSSASDEFTIGFALFINRNVDTDYRIVDFRLGGSTSCRLEVTEFGRLRLNVGTATVIGSSTIILKRSDWYYIELQWAPDPANSVGTVRVDGVDEISVSGVASDAGESTIDTFILTGLDSRVDDLYVLDDTGGSFNTFLGDVFVTTLRPTADSSPNDFTPSSGIDNYAMVDDTGGPDDDSTYVESDVVNATDFYDVEDLTLSPTTVHAVATTATWKKDDGGARTSSTKIRSNGTVNTGSAFTLDTSYDKHQDIFTVDPDGGGAWSETSVNNVEIGHEVTS